MITRADSIDLNRVGHILISFTNTLQDAPGNVSEKETAVACLFNLLNRKRKGMDTLRRTSWELQEAADNVLEIAKEGYPQFYATAQFVKNDLK